MELFVILLVALVGVITYFVIKNSSNKSEFTPNKKLDEKNPPSRPIMTGGQIRNENQRPTIQKTYLEKKLEERSKTPQKFSRPNYPPPPPRRPSGRSIPRSSSSSSTSASSYDDDYTRRQNESMMTNFFIASSMFDSSNDCSSNDSYDCGSNDNNSCCSE